MTCAVPDCPKPSRPMGRTCPGHWRAIPSHLRHVLVQARDQRHTDHATHLRARAAEVDLATTYARRAA